MFLRGAGKLFLAEKSFPAPLNLPPPFQKPRIGSTAGRRGV
ncbi:hypothetical protein DESPIGER_2080 [Desulfovibrio piger]|uniref:Uncharacterized protein n=1 Tax=Desulfovibrio piger TaxID=901 RepID=A0A1K1LGT3_9BACT|nr:hypothetical protein DESPIGER_2080 [Desulfovibrio piger]